MCVLTICVLILVYMLDLCPCSTLLLFSSYICVGTLLYMSGERNRHTHTATHILLQAYCYTHIASIHILLHTYCYTHTATRILLLHAYCYYNATMYVSSDVVILRYMSYYICQARPIATPTRHIRSKFVQSKSREAGNGPSGLRGSVADVSRATSSVAPSSAIAGASGLVSCERCSWLRGV